jgi:hypothetical protein
VLCLAAMLAGMACRHGSSPAVSGITPSTGPAENPPFTISQPLDPAVALDERGLNGSSWYVLDLDTGFIQVIAPDLGMERIDAQGGRAGVFPSWFDNDALLVRNIDGATYVAELGGVIRPSAAPISTPTIPSPTGGGVSRDRRWQASVTAVDGPGVVIGTLLPGGRGEPRFKVTMATLPLWSPSAPATLALLVNACSGPDANGGFDLNLFDPVTGELRGLNASPSQLIPAFVWRPDGSGIVADVVFSGDSETEPRRELQLIDVTRGVARTLVAITQAGELVPVEWNRDANKLLFAYNPGRGICDGTQPPGPPSELKHLGS